MVYFLPREGKFMFEYQKGGFWKHEDLTAPFTFPISKSPQEVAKERDSVLREFRPIFNYDNTVSEQRIKELSEAFSNAWISYTLTELKVPSRDEYRRSRSYAQHRQLENQYRSYLISIVRDIYRKGIVDLSPVEEGRQYAYEEIVIVRDNIANQTPLSELFTPRTAYEHVIERLNSSIPKKDNLLIRRYDRFFSEFGINNYLSTNVTYDELKSTSVRKSLINGVSLTRGLIQEGQGIISRGEYISNDKYLILESLRKEYERNLGFMERQLVILGKLILLIASLTVIYLFLRSFRKEVLDSNRRIAFILLIILIMMIIASASIRFGLLSVYVLPFSILPIILKTFFDSRLALFVHIITILVVGFFVPNGYEFVFLNVLAGMVAIISLTDAYRRSKIVFTAMAVMLTYSIIYFGIALVQEGDLTQIDYKYFSWFGVNGLLILISYPLLYIFEKTFGFISDATLMELSDTNQPLLRKLAENAPGTFQHSLQVANLAEDAIYRIGGNPLLVRAGALYHDIGKMDEPHYYIENQSSTINPHDDLEFEQSARIIIDHVRKGAELAKKNKLPEPIINFIRTHHGTTTVQYFYKSFLRKYPEAEVDVQKFSYPGPKPDSKETAIVMMADSVEAASRSLKSITESAIDKLVDSIITSQMTDEQYNDAHVTFKDITTVKEVFKKRLRNIYHVRISYPA
ncbi:MAG TPA: HDIG domain-containing protein [Bacteroidales bacterium]|nr:HDIG domain-containing protein [Bacteroidales bacterium]